MSKNKSRTLYRAIMTKRADAELGDVWRVLLMFSDGHQRTIEVTDIRGAAHEIRMIEDAELGGEE